MAGTASVPNGYPVNFCVSWGRNLFAVKKVFAIMTLWLGRYEA
jgi:hypothetical protein